MDGEEYKPAFGPTGFDQRHPPNFCGKCLMGNDSSILYPTSLDNGFPQIRCGRFTPTAPERRHQGPHPEQRPQGASVEGIAKRCARSAGPVLAACRGRWLPRLVVRRTVAARPAHHEALSLATAPGGALNPGECRGEMRRAWMWRGGAFCVARCSLRGRCVANYRSNAAFS
jgi:hypothetical protein